MDHLEEANIDTNEWLESTNTMMSYDYTKSLRNISSKYKVKCRHTPSQHDDNCYVSYIVNIPESDGKLPRFYTTTEQITKIRFNAETKTWQGLVRSVYGKAGKETSKEKDTQDNVEDLENDWMIENFDEALLERIKAREQQDSRFIKLPPGRPRLSSKIPGHLASSQAPEVYYLQGTKKEHVQQILLLVHCFTRRI